MDVIRDLWVCVDCLFYLANGDLPEDEDSAEAVVAGCDRELPYVWALDGPHAVECAACDGTGEDPDAPCEAGCDVCDCPPGVCSTCDGTGTVSEPEGADTREFSWSDCDCCGSDLGGSRHRAALIGPDEKGGGE